jgi:hypothetical protein
MVGVAVGDSEGVAVLGPSDARVSGGVDRRLELLLGGRVCVLDLLGCFGQQSYGGFLFGRRLLGYRGWWFIVLQRYPQARLRTWSKKRDRTAFNRGGRMPGYRAVTWVVVEEVASGDWGIGGNPLHTADVKALAAGQPVG